MSTIAFIAAIAMAMAAVATGRFTAWTTIRRLRIDLADASDRALRDPLTGLPNRAAAPELFTRASTADTVATVILIDLDGFKNINDTHGHHAGDQLLATVARRLAGAACVLGGSAVRLGGDEFLLILPAAHTDMATAVACSIFRPAATVQLDSRLGPVDVQPCGSAGIAVPGHGDETLTGLLARADAALYHAKHLGGNRYEVHTPGIGGALAKAQRGTRLRDRHPGRRPAAARWEIAE